MKVLAVFATAGKAPSGQPFSGTSNRVFEIEQLDEAAVVFMEEAIVLDRGQQQPGHELEWAVLMNVIKLEG